MAERDLSREERRLWHLYTKNIKSTSPPIAYQQNQNVKTSFNIKVPKRDIFNKHPQPTLSNFESLKDKDSNWGRKLRQGKVRPDGKIDLHGMTCVQAHEKLYHYFERAQQKGHRVILVVTGKGGPKKSGYADIRYSDFESSRGVLRREVPLWLSSGALRHLIVSFQDARQRDGGSGALYVVLKRI